MEVRREIWAHHAMASVGGFFGAYALLIRGGTFGSSETSNLIYLVISGLDGSWGAALVRLGGHGNLYRGNHIRRTGAAVPLGTAAPGPGHCRRLRRLPAAGLDSGGDGPYPGSVSHVLRHGAAMVRLYPGRRVQLRHHLFHQQPPPVHGGRNRISLHP